MELTQGGIQTVTGQSRSLRSQSRPHMELSLSRVKGVSVRIFRQCRQSHRSSSVVGLVACLSTSLYKQCRLRERGGVRQDAADGSSESFHRLTRRTAIGDDADDRRRCRRQGRAAAVIMRAVASRSLSQCCEWPREDSTPGARRPVTSGHHHLWR